MPVIDLGSVVGPTGATGATGAQGPQGIQGNPGPNQITANTSTTLNGILKGNGNNVTTATVDSSPSASHVDNLISSAGVADAISSAGNFADPTLIEDGTDLNTLTSPGCYRCSTIAHAKTMVNAPWAVNSDEAWPFTLFVVRLLQSDATYYIQVLISAAQVYTRRHYQTTYSDWTSMQKKVESDIAGISLWGSTNTTGGTISAGTYFYLKGTLVRAIANIANNATFTNGTNYAAVTAGGLNKIESDLAARFGETLRYIGNFGGSTSGQTYTFTLEQSQYPFFVVIYRDSYGGGTGNADLLGLYMGRCRIASGGAAGGLRTILASSGATLSLDVTTGVLSMATTNTYMYAKIYQV